MDLNGPAIVGARQLQKTRQIEEAKKRLDEVVHDEQKSRTTNAVLEASSTTRIIDSDWTESYKFWNKWTDTEDIVEKRKTEEQKLEDLMTRPDFMGHYHDHSEERLFFEKSEKEKMNYCERHRHIGNYLYQEGFLPKAAEQYQIALSYYEYCFPGDSSEQQSLDGLRHACLCNISLCYFKLGYYRKAIESASHVIDEDMNNPKACFRRAVAYRALDEYKEAERDLRRALTINPGDKVVLLELQSLNKQKVYSLGVDKQIAVRMLSEPTKELPRSGSAEMASTEKSNGSTYYDVLDFTKPLEPVLDEIDFDLTPMELSGI